MDVEEGGNTKELNRKVTVDNELTLEQIAKWRETIAEMPHIEMARLVRFAPSGHPVFDTRYPLHEQFEARFKSFGGMTPDVSKTIGWE